VPPPKSAKTIISLIKTLSSQLHSLPLYQVRINYFLQLYESETLTLSEIKQKTRDFIDKSSDSLIKIRDLLVIYKYYQEELTRRGLYDYEDMILWVIVALQTHPELLLTYQENYQYLLVDEFQDTNSSQMEILNLLVKNQNHPNIFVVGDDDQSIYRFQGANVENLYSFYQNIKRSLK